MACKLNFWFDLNQTLTRGWVCLLPTIGDCSKNQSRPTLRIRLTIRRGFCSCCLKGNRLKLDKRQCCFGQCSHFVKRCSATLSREDSHWEQERGRLEKALRRSRD